MSIEEIGTDGPAPAHCCTLGSLAEPAGFDALAARLRPLVDSDRQAGITLVHYAVAAVAESVLVWVLAQGAVLDVGPDDVGLCLETDGSASTWIHRVRPRHSKDAAFEAGRVAWGLVAAIAETAAERAPAGRRAVTMITLDALIAAARRVGREVRAEPDATWIGQFLAGAGHPGHEVGRELLVRPDDGAPVAFYVPRVCCVLNTGPSPHACPTCPMLPSDEVRTERILAMLGDLDHDDFRNTAGRPRVGAPRAG
ncbi:MAG: hypothetical protein U0838_13420 [Chloroflexota bacterium]